MNKLCFVKKDPSLPASNDNWIVMQYGEYCNFLNTPEGKLREPYFTELNACDYDDYIYYIECDTPQIAKDVRSDKDASDYQEKNREESGYETLSYHAELTDDPDITGEEVIKDESCNVEAEALTKVIHEIVAKEVNRLPSGDRDLIQGLSRSVDRLSVAAYSRQSKLPYYLAVYKRDKLYAKLRNRLINKHGIYGGAEND